MIQRRANVAHLLRTPASEAMSRGIVESPIVVSAVAWTGSVGIRALVDNMVAMFGVPQGPTANTDLAQYVEAFLELCNLAVG